VTGQGSWRSRLGLLGLALLLAGPALACRLVTEGLPEPAATPTSFPTATALPAETATPAATEIALQSYDNEELGLSFSYPAGWLLDDSEDIPLVASDAAALGDEELTGGAYVLILVENASQVANDPLEASLESLIAELHENDEFVSGPEMTAVQGQEAATATLQRNTEEGATLHSIYTLVRRDERAALIVAEVTREEEPLYRDVLAAITGSVVLREPAGPVVAGDIVYGETVSGEVASLRGSAWRFAGAAGDVINVEVTPADEALDVTVDVVDGAGVSILPGLVDDAFGTERIAGLALPGDGDYLIVLRGFAGSTGAYTLTLALSDGEPVEQEPLFQESIRLVVQDELGAEEVSGHAFPFYAPEGAGIGAEVVPVEGLDIVVELWNDDEDTPVEIVDESFDIEQVEFVAPAEGNYSLVVRGFEGQAGGYTITLAGSGSIILELAVGDLVTGLFDEQAAIEFLIGLNPNETITLSVEPDGQTDAVLELSDLDGNPLAGADEHFAGAAESVTFTAPPEIAEGTLYAIRVSDFSSRTGGSFTLTVAGQGAG
jgi:hypothetical protein